MSDTITFSFTDNEKEVLYEDFTTDVIYGNLLLDVQGNNVYKHYSITLPVLELGDKLRTRTIILYKDYCFVKELKIIPRNKIVFFQSIVNPKNKQLYHVVIVDYKVEIK